jgi:hypothetical protein
LGAFSDVALTVVPSGSQPVQQDDPDIGGSIGRRFASGLPATGNRPPAPAIRSTAGRPSPKLLVLPPSARTRLPRVSSRSRSDPRSRRGSSPVARAQLDREVAPAVG